MKVLAHLCFVVAALSKPCFACPFHGPSEVNPLESAYRHLHARNASSPIRTAIRNVQVFDGESMTSPQTIYIENGLIVEAHHSMPEPAVEVDGTGKFLIPGLIDSHIHADSISILETLTSYGVTTVVNMMCYSYVLWAELANVSGLAAMFTSTVGVTEDARALANGALYGMNPDLWWQPGEPPAHFVDRQFFPGTPSTFMKIVVYPDTQAAQPTQEQYTNFVNATRELGYHSATHATSLGAYRKAVTSKAEILQHMAADSPLPQDMIDQIVQNGQHVTPTMSVFRIATNEPIIQTYLNQSLHGEQGFDTVTANVAALHKAGVPLLAGTDSTHVAQYNFSLPYGLDLHCELEFLVGAGLTPAEALRAGTVSAVQVQRLGNRGVISPGMRADLVLLNSNPLANITNTRDIARVWAGGIEYGSVTKNLTQPGGALSVVREQRGAGAPALMAIMLDLEIRRLPGSPLRELEEKRKAKSAR